jgi:hypothetical protein
MPLHPSLRYSPAAHAVLGFLVGGVVGGLGGFFLVGIVGAAVLIVRRTRRRVGARGALLDALILMLCAVAVGAEFGALYLLLRLDPGMPLEMAFKLQAFLEVVAGAALGALIGWAAAPPKPAHRHA